MKIKDVMKRDFVSVRCDDSLLDVARAVLTNGAVAVLDPNDDLVGVIAESDLLPAGAAVRGPGRAARLLRAAVAGPDPDWSTWSAQLRASDVMMPPASPVQEDDDPSEIGRGMLESNVRHMPVMRGAILVGVLARPELLRLLRGSDLTLQRAVERLLWRCRFAPPEYNIDIDIDGGTVLVEGEVERESDVRVVGSLIAGLDGVAGVKNMLSVRSLRSRALA